MNLLLEKISTITSVGLLFDIFGAIWLAQSVVLTSSKFRELKTTTFWDANPYSLIAEDDIRYNTLFSSIFLILGFIGQFVGQFYQRQIHFLSIPGILLILIAIGISFKTALRDYLRRKVPAAFAEKHGSGL